MFFAAEFFCHAATMIIECRGGIEKIAKDVINKRNESIFSYNLLVDSSVSVHNDLTLMKKFKLIFIEQIFSRIIDVFK